MTKASTHTSRSRIDDDTTTLRARAIEARAAAEAALAAAERAAKAAEPRPPDDSPGPGCRRAAAESGKRGWCVARAPGYNDLPRRGRVPRC